MPRDLGRGNSFFPINYRWVSTRAVLCGLCSFSYHYSPFVRARQYFMKHYGWIVARKKKRGIQHVGVTQSTGLKFRGQDKDKCCMWSQQSRVSPIHTDGHTGAVVCWCTNWRNAGTNTWVLSVAMSLHACVWVAYDTLSPFSWAHDASSSLADTICMYEALYPECVW